MLVMLVTFCNSDWNCQYTFKNVSLYIFLWRSSFIKISGPKMAKFVQKFANPDDADDKTLVNMDARAPYYLQQLEEIAAMKEPFLSQLQDQPQL